MYSYIEKNERTYTHMKQYNIHYLTVEDVMDITGYKIGKSYKIMRELNKELKKQNIVTYNGKVDKRYFFERLGLLHDYNKKSLEV